MFSSEKGQVGHTTFITGRVPEKVSAQNTVPDYQRICCTSMADHSVIYLPFYLFTKGTTEYSKPECIRDIPGVNEA